MAAETQGAEGVRLDALAKELEWALSEGLVTDAMIDAAQKLAALRAQPAQKFARDGCPRCVMHHVTDVYDLGGRFGGLLHIGGAVLNFQTTNATDRQPAPGETEPVAWMVQAQVREDFTVETHVYTGTVAEETARGYVDSCLRSNWHMARVVPLYASSPAPGGAEGTRLEAIQWLGSNLAECKTWLGGDEWKKAGVDFDHGHITAEYFGDRGFYRDWLVRTEQGVRIVPEDVMVALRAHSSEAPK